MSAPKRAKTMAPIPIGAAAFTSVPALRQMVTALQAVPQHSIPIAHRRHVLQRIKVSGGGGGGAFRFPRKEEGGPTYVPARGAGARAGGMRGARRGARPRATVHLLRVRLSSVAARLF